MVEGGATFLNFVRSQNLGPLWHFTLQQNSLLDSLPLSSIDALHEARMSAAVGYLPQRLELERIDQLFEAHNIPYLVIKGVHVRECVYPDPALRPASDIDILVAPNDRQQAARILLDTGYTVDIEPDNISHEATFSRGMVDIDLHWHMLRPGRTRVDMTDGLLARRQRVNGIWGLSDDDTLFMMLTHPAFAKYVCSPNMGLGRAADFLLWVQRRKVDWPAVLQLLDKTGLKTAAWTMLSWFRMLAQPEAVRVIDEWLDPLRPGWLRAAYLRYWLTQELPTRWLQRPILIQLGFTLLLHDRPTDALHALQGRWQARQNRVRDEHLLLGDAYRLDGEAA